MIALIPARAGSTRIPGKNTKLLGGVPLIVWTIQAAITSLAFTDIAVCSDDPEVLAISDDYGLITHRRDVVSDVQPDVEWVRVVLSHLPEYRAFCILRPTSPFRSAETIQCAARQWRRECDCIDSIRAVRPVAESPYKMWVQHSICAPLTPFVAGTHPDGTPYHSSPTQTLPAVYVQTGALEMGWTRNVECFGTISGRKLSPLYCSADTDGLDLNTERDWAEAERLVATGQVQCPTPPLARISGDPRTV